MPILTVGPDEMVLGAERWSAEGPRLPGGELLDLRAAWDEGAWATDVFGPRVDAVIRGLSYQDIAEYHFASPYEYGFAETVRAVWDFEAGRENVFLSAGVTSALVAVSRAVGQGTAVIDDRGYYDVAEWLRRSGAEVIRPHDYTLDGWLQILDAVPQGAVLVVQRPPVVGQALSLDECHALVAGCQSSGNRVIFDEASANYLDAGQSAIDCCKQGLLGSVTLRSVSKGFFAGGVRLGYGVGDPESVAWLCEHVTPLEVSAVSVRLGTAFVRNENLLDPLRHTIAAARARITDAFDGSGTVLAPTDGRVPWLIPRVSPAWLRARGIVGREVPGYGTRVFLPLSQDVLERLEELLGEGDDSPHSRGDVGG